MRGRGGGQRSPKEEREKRDNERMRGEGLSQKTEKGAPAPYIYRDTNHEETKAIVYCPIRGEDHEMREGACPGGNDQVFGSFHPWRRGTRWSLQRTPGDWLPSKAQLGGGFSILHECRGRLSRGGAVCPSWLRAAGSMVRMGLGRKRVGSHG